MAARRVTADPACRSVPNIDGRGRTPSGHSDPRSRLHRRASARTRVAAHTQRIDEQPVRALVDASGSAGLLVVGMRGVGPGEVVSGSVALAVSGAARCPVTVVRGQRQTADQVGRCCSALRMSHSMPAVTAAFADAQQRRAPLRVLHTLHGFFRDRVTGRDAAADALVDQLAPWRVQYPQVPIKVQLVHGQPVDELLRAAATADLVVVGTHGRSAPARLLLGSTSRAVVRYGPCLVMVVRWDAVVGDVIGQIARASSVKTL
jgi:nucleotide-binding universal stress UspA family protein